MTRKQKLEIMVPIWPGRDNESYWGSNDYCSYNVTDTVTSTWISLRAINHSDEYSYMNEADRAINDMGVYVWASTDGTVSIDIRLHDIHSLTERDLELRLKHLKALRRKVSKTFHLDSFSRGADIHTELTRFFAALGVWRSIEYRRDLSGKSNDVFDAVGIAINRIADTLDKRLDKQGRKTA